jgi:general L-amino acid transport system substrate-binding protein
MNLKRIAILGCAIAALLCAGKQAGAGPTLDAAKAHGAVACGVNGGLPGFSFVDSQGRWTGLDVDFCRAVAAAVLGDATKVKFVPLTSQTRIPALQSGEVDVLSRNTTWTITRDTTLGLSFTAVTFYDGQAFMVPRRGGMKSATQLSGATVCVLPGSTTEMNLADYFRSRGMSLKPLVIENLDQLNSAYFAGRCDAYISDASQLASIRTTAPNPDDHIILPEIISKEPLTPVVRSGDQQWFDVVRWTVYATIEAEEHDISSTNVDQATKSENPEIKRFLGVAQGYGKGMGLDDHWAYNIVKQVGNYGEIFERNVGKNTPLKLGRGLNALWINGGLMYAMPLR